VTAPFGRLPLPDGLEVFALPGMAGELTALAAPAVGASRGVALLVPGFTGSKEDFRLLLPAIAGHGWDAIAFSNRGQADSVAPAGSNNYRLEDFAADLVAIAEALDVGGIHLVGHSMGGLIARAALVARPDLFVDVTLLCSGPAGRPGRHQDEADFVAAHGLLALWERDNPVEAARISAARLSAIPGSAIPGSASPGSAFGNPDASAVLRSDTAFVRDRMAATSVDHYLGAVTVLQTAPDISDGVRQTGVPVLVAHGDADDAWPIADQKAMAERIGAQYSVIPNAGHLPNIDNPDFTAALLSEFWASHPARA
jgi:pimeloyl-ACP methyl ester carboxylesterase